MSGLVGSEGYSDYDLARMRYIVLRGLPAAGLLLVGSLVVAATTNVDATVLWIAFVLGVVTISVVLMRALEARFPPSQTPVDRTP